MAGILSLTSDSIFVSVLKREGPKGSLHGYMKQCPASNRACTLSAASICPIAESLAIAPAGSSDTFGQSLHVSIDAHLYM
jgi:hypothetical protein